MGNLGADSSRIQDRYAYYDIESGEFYILNDDAPALACSSGDTGIVYLTDNSEIDNQKDSISNSDYKVVDMEEYYTNNFHKYNGDYDEIIEKVKNYSPR